jgi:hypothetical protein
VDLARFGYRIWPEIDWLTSAFVAAGFHPNTVFFANEDRYYNVDCCMAVQHVSIFGPQGKGKLRLGTRHSTGSGEGWDSLDLRDVMAANSSSTERRGQI